MKKKRSMFMPYAIVLVLNFYVLPLLIRDTGIAMFIMLFVIPFFTFVCAVIYGVRHGFDSLLTIIVAVLFAPSIFIFYNISAWIYIVAYAVIALAGNGLGKVFYKKR